MVSNVESEFPSTSLWYDTYSAQESLETQAMVCHGQVGGEGQLGLSQTVFSSFLSFFFSSYLYLIAFLSCCFPLFSFSFSFYQFWRTTRLISDWFIYSFFSIWFISYCSYLNAFPYILFLFRSTNDQWAVKDNWVYLRLLASLCNPLCAVIKEWWHWWRFWNNWNKYILYLLLWKFYFQNRSDLENESESDAMPFQFRSTAISFQTLHFQLCKGTDDN